MNNQLLKLRDLVMQGGDLPELLEKDFPLIIPDYQSVTDFIYSDIEDTQKIQTIMDAYAVKQYLEDNRPHDNKENNPYNAYLNLNNSEFEPIDKKTFISLLNAISAISLNNKLLSFSEKTTDTFDIFSRLGVSNEDMFRFIYDVRSGNDIQYIKNLCNAQLNSTDLTNWIKRAVTNISREPMILIDALCLLSHHDDYSDDVLECKFILNQVIDSCTRTNPKHIYFINANPYFVRTIMEKAFFKSFYLSFSMEDNDCAECFSNHYLNSNATFTTLTNLLAHISEEGKYPDLTVVFGNRSEKLYTETLEAISVLVNSAPEVHGLMILDTDHHIKAPSSSLHDILVGTELISVDLIPDDIPSITFPKRKSLIQCRYGFFEEYSHDIELRHYSNITQNGFPAISCKAFTTSMTYEEFDDESISLRGKFRKDKMLHDVRTSKQLNQPNPYFFSPEICFFVNVSGQGTDDSPYRLSAYARRPKKNNTRPPKIYLSSASTKVYTIHEIDEWTTEIYPYTKTKEENQTSTVRAAVSKEYKSFFKGKPISLKTFLYIYEEFEQSQPKEVLSEIRIWMNSYIGEYRLDLISESILEEYLSFRYNYGRSISYYQALEIFRRLFSFAISKSHCKNNPANSLQNRNRVSNEDLYDINSALKRKMLYLKEILRLKKHFNELFENNHPLAIALYILLFLGLEPNIICALVWSDFKKQTVNGNTFYSLYIRRQLNTEGTKFLQFKRREYYRIIPIPKFISEMLLTEKAYQLEHIAKNNEEYLMDCSIISGSDHILNGQAMVMAPKTLYKECNKILKALKASDITLTVPTDNGGTTETNLSYYGTDIFRSNFRHYNCFNGSEEKHIFSKGEYCYLSGLKGPDTFSRNYCDYGNPKSLLKLYKKIEQLARRMNNGV